MILPFPVKILQVFWQKVSCAEKEQPTWLPTGSNQCTSHYSIHLWNRKGQLTPFPWCVNKTGPKGLPRKIRPLQTLQQRQVNFLLIPPSHIQSGSGSYFLVCWNVHWTACILFCKLRSKAFYIVSISLLLEYIFTPYSTLYWPWQEQAKTSLVNRCSQWN